MVHLLLHQFHAAPTAIAVIKAKMQEHQLHVPVLSVAAIYFDVFILS